MKRIVIFGATGMLGRPVAEKLIEGGHEVRISSRDPRKVEGFGGAPVVEADLLRPETLPAALRGMDAVYLSLSADRKAGPAGPHTEREGLRNLLASAREAGIRRIGLISSLVMNYQGMDGFRSWEFEMKHEAVKMLRACGIPFLIFRPSTFMENFIHEQRQGNRILLAGRSRQPMWFIAGADYGEMVARAFDLPEGESRDYPVQGPEPFTYDEAAEVFIGQDPEKKLRISRAPETLLHALGLFSENMRSSARIVRALNRYPERFESEGTWKELGKPKITLVMFARKALGAAR